MELVGKSAETMSLENDIQHPLESAQSLHRLLHEMINVFKHNFIAGKQLCMYGSKSHY